MLRSRLTALASQAHRLRLYSTVSANAPFKLAVVGSGPAGFYTALRVLESMAPTTPVQVDMFEALPVPYGLARFGVAPDHPEVKVCTDRFDDAAGFEGFRFVGNTRVGVDVSLRDLKDAYNGVVLSYGSSEDRKLGIKGEELKGVIGAREFVGWYNGLPECRGLDVRLDKAEDVTVIGNGNVALDVARILLSDLSRIKSTDIMDEAYEALSKSTVRNVRIVGRRGLLQSAFTTKEVRELVNEPGVVMKPLQERYIETYRPFMPVLDRVKKRLVGVIEKASAAYDPAKAANSKTWTLDYLLSPAQFNEAYSSDGLLESTRFEINTLEQAEVTSPAVAQGTGEFVTLKNELAFRSIGYKSVSLPGLSEDLGVYFDERRGFIPNSFGRAFQVSSASSGEPVVVPGVYAAGWVKTGPTGVIATTMRESFEVAESIIQDYNAGVLDRQHKPGFEGVRDKIKSDVVSWSGWLKIDAAEKQNGHKLGKPREKFETTEKMLEAAKM